MSSVSDDHASTLRTDKTRVGPGAVEAGTSALSGNVLAFGAIVLWGSLAWLGVRLATVPPFLLVGTALTIAGVLGLPSWRRWRMPMRVVALGVYGLFGFHFFLFVALRLAPPLQANLINYLWPLLMVVLAPLLLDASRLSRWHVLGGLLGLTGAVVAMTNGHVLAGSTDFPSGRAPWGYASALLSAFIWATYSLMSQRLRRGGVAFSTASIGLFCLCSGLLALTCHAWLEPSYRFNERDLWPMAALAIGPMGTAFLVWDAALRRGDARTIGTLAYLTPVLSTIALSLDDPTRFGWPSVVALVLVVAGAVVGTKRAALSAPDHSRSSEATVQN